MYRGTSLPTVEQAGLLFPLRGQYVPVPYLRLSSQRDAVSYKAQSSSCGELTNRTFSKSHCHRDKCGLCGLCIFCSYCSVKKNLPLYIQSLIDVPSESLDVLSESLSSDAASHFSWTSSSTILLSLEWVFFFPAAEFTKRRGTRGGQRLIMANNPISQRLPLTDTVWSWVGPLPIPHSAYPQEHSELNQTLISPLLWW